MCCFRPQSLKKNSYHKFISCYLLYDMAELPPTPPTSTTNQGAAEETAQQEHTGIAPRRKPKIIHREAVLGSCNMHKMDKRQ